MTFNMSKAQALNRAAQSTLPRIEYHRKILIAAMKAQRPPPRSRFEGRPPPEIIQLKWDDIEDLATLLHDVAQKFKAHSE